MLKGAIIGFGEVASKGHWPGYQNFEKTKIVAVVDRTESRREAARMSIPGVATYATIDELAAGSQIDFVDICTPPALHAELILAALAKNWSVLCEKPLLIELAELDHVRDASQKAGRAVVPVHNWKYAPIIQRATELLHSGMIGRLHQVEMQTLRINDCTAVDPDHPNWRRDPAIAGGGILMDHGWHAIYLARHWFGVEPYNIRVIFRRAPNGVEDEASLTLIFPKGRGEIFLTWRSDKRRNAMRLIGERGEIRIDDDTLKAGNSSILYEKGLSAGSHHPDWFAAMLPDVIKAFQQPQLARDFFMEASLCLSVIRRAYSIA